MAAEKNKKSKRKLPRAKRGRTASVTRRSSPNKAGGPKAEAKGQKKGSKIKAASVTKKRLPADKIKQTKAQKARKEKTSTAVIPAAQRKNPRKKTAQALSKGVRSFKEPEKLTDLPREYGENELLVMVVDPNVMFAAWEITKDSLANSEGDLHLRAFDVTAGPDDVSGETPSFDIKIEDRVGSGFFDIKMPGRKIRSELGLLSPAEVFIPLLRSDVVSFPEVLTPDELGIAGEFLEWEIPFGY